MPHELACPSCGQDLRIPDDPTEPWLTCPSCLARVRNPGYVPGRSAEVSSQAITASAPATRTGACPRCGKPTESVWRFCPYCEAPLTQRLRSRWPDLPDREVRRDTQRIGAGLVFLACLGAAGIGYMLFVGVGALGQGTAAPLLVGAIILLFLVLVSTGVMFWRTRANPAGRGMGRIVFGTLALAGALVAGVFALVLAFVIFVFAICLTGSRF